MQSSLGSVILAAKDKQAAKLDLTRDDREAIAIEEPLGLTVDTRSESPASCASSHKYYIKSK